MNPEIMFATTAAQQVAVIDQLDAVYGPLKDQAQKDYELGRRALIFAIDALGYLEQRMLSEQKLAAMLGAIREKAAQGKYVSPSTDTGTVPQLPSPAGSATGPRG